MKSQIINTKLRMGQHDPSLATKNNKILISACNRGKGEQRE